MNIVHIIPGSGGSFYCENCVRDKSYLSALEEMGHEVSIIPMYLPLFIDEKITFYDAPVFYGAVNLYLKLKFPWLEKMPRFLTRFLNSRAILKFAASKAGSTRAEGLEEMTISMLLGEEGQQKEELDIMINWLKHHLKPDVIHLSNALLLGLARKMKQELNIPVVCNLQDEDVWVEEMEPVAKEETWKIMQERAKDVDAFISVSKFYAKKMQEQLKIPDNKLHTIYIGIDNQAYQSPDLTKDKQVIGYLSRMCSALGLDILADAFIILKKDPKFTDLQLHITGGKTSDDQKFINSLITKFKKENILQDVKFINIFDTSARIDFLKELCVLSVPVKNGEAFGLFQLEALAAGVPLVLPKLGAFPEIIEETKGGVTYSPNTAEALAESLKATLSDKEKLQKMGKIGKENLEKKLNDKEMSKKLIQVYELIKDSKLNVESSFTYSL